MSETKTTPVDDWEALFDRNYLRWFHLASDVLARITKVERGVEMVLPGGAKTKRSVIHWALAGGELACDGPKPLVLNTTNAQKISQLHGRKPSKWPGKEIVFYRTETKLKGKTVSCVRIREKGKKS
ncbi:MAG: hypothetical protein AAF497_21695 [Planctomycetota bacterium]